MIVVIADDLSGAAELAGAAFRLGLTAEVQTLFNSDVSSRVICLDMEGRAASAEAAAADTRDVYRVVAGTRPEWIFFKFDSVLRGNIVAQLRAALEVSGRQRAMLITANPSRGRTIHGGDYFVDGVPLHRTAFADDPLFPRSTSNVRKLLGTDAPEILTPDVDSTSALQRWARATDERTLLAGSAEFFETLLHLRGDIDGARPIIGSEDRATGAASVTQAMPWRPLLIVCGSRVSWETRAAEARDRGIGAFDILDDVSAAAAALTRDGALLVGIGERLESGSASPTELLDRLGEMVAAICRQVRPARLLLEGGATADAVVRRMGWSRLICEEGVGGGVGTLRPTGQEEPQVLIKPGSYPWPEEVWP